MNGMADDRLRQTFSRVPVFEGHSFESAAIERIGGLNNRDYKVTIGDDAYVLRVPGEGTEEYVDRAADEHAGRITAELGVNAEIVFYESGSGVQLTRFIENGVTMTPTLFKDLDAVRRAGRGFAKVHTSGRPFLTRFNDVEVAKDYLKILREKGSPLPEGYEDVQKEALVVREALAAKALPLVPSHNDPVPEQFLNTEERMYILDWEFAGNNDPMWDLGDLSVEAGFSEEQDRALLEAYCDGPFPDHLFSRMMLQKSMVFLLWTLWGALQVANENPLKPSDIHYPFDNFWDYTMDRFVRCQEIMGGPDFGKCLANVRQ